MPIANSSIFLEQITKQALWKQTSTQQLLVFTILQSAHCVLKSIASYNNNNIIQFLLISSEAAIAQWLERLSSKQEVMSSILIGGLFYSPCTLGLFALLNIYSLSYYAAGFSVWSAPNAMLWIKSYIISAQLDHIVKTVGIKAVV